MNTPQVYMCSPSWTLLPPPSPFHPSGSSQRTSPKHPVSCIKPGLATRFIHDIDSLNISCPMCTEFVQQIHIWDLSSLSYYSCKPITINRFPFPESYSVISDSLQPHGLYRSWNSPGQNTWVGSLSFLQRIFSTQGLNPGLSHFRRILYWVSHQGSPRILEWVTYPFSSRSSWPRNWTRVSCIEGGFFTSWATREALAFSRDWFSRGHVTLVASGN